MTRFGVTGSAKLLTAAQAHYVRRRVARSVLRSKRNTLVSGMAYGVDTEAVLAVWGLLPFSNIIAAIPGTCNHNWGLHERLRDLDARIVMVPNKHTVSQTYMARNDLVVAHCDVLLAFPRTRNEEKRSGTWATVRRARSAGLKVRIYPLDEAQEDNDGDS